MRIILSIVANSLAILAANKLVPGFEFSGSWVSLAIAGAVIGFLNGIIRPIVKLLALPVIIFTLGLASLIINIFLLLLADWFLADLQIKGFVAAFWGTLIIGLTNYLVFQIHNDNKK